MRYRAFISYSHADEAWARWLMRRLEAYRVPSRLVGEAGIDGPIPARLGAFFRDRDELTASGDLAATIRAALAESAALIVVCSPAAAQSRWVGAEVQAFRDSGRGDRILAFVVDGEPGQAAGEHACFPPPLIAPGEDGQPVEPLAADARTTADGRERAFIKLVAGLLGVGYDQLAQREAHRKQRRLMQVAVASLAGMTLALGLAATAYVARNDAQRRQAQAEDILGFMLGDLREKLTTVGRLDLMRAVDDKAAGYFASLDPRDLSDRALEEQARSLTGIGQVRLEEGNHDKAMAAFREAHERSTALHDRQPGNGQRLFDLAQAEYWIGFVALEQGRLDGAEAWFRRYRDSAIRLAAMDRGNFDWQKEVAYGHHGMAVLDERRGRYAEAERAMLAELALYRDWTRRFPDNTELRFEAANVASWLGSLMLGQGKLAQAQAYFSEEVAAHAHNARIEPNNARWKIAQIDSLVLLTEVQAMRRQYAEARVNIDAATSLAGKLMAADPSNNGRRTAMGLSRWWQARLQTTLGTGDAVATTEQAVDLLAAAHAAEPESERVLTWLVRAYQLRAQLALSANDIATADKEIGKALALVEPAWQAVQNERLRQWRAWSWLLRGDIAQRQGDPATATRAWTLARDLLQEGGDPLPFARLDPLVRTLLALGQAGEAATLARRLEGAGYVPLEAPPLAIVASLQ